MTKGFKCMYVFDEVNILISFVGANKWKSKKQYTDSYLEIEAPHLWKQ